MVRPWPIVWAAVVASMLSTACAAPSSTLEPTPSARTDTTSASPPAMGMTPTPAPTPAATEAPSLALPAGWEVVLESPESQAFDMLASGDTVLLAGEDGGGFVLERSPAGHWGRPMRPEPGPSSVVTDLAEGMGAVVAIGMGPVDASGDPWPIGMAWRRVADRWAPARVTVTELVPYLHAVAWDEDRFVAVGDVGCIRPTYASVGRARLASAPSKLGAESDRCADDPSWSRPMAWTSPDGALWTPDRGLPDDAGWLYDVVRGPAGPLAVGQRLEHPAAWLRVAGSWQRVELPVDEGWADIATVADTYELLSRGAEGTALWRSGDARTWERVPLDMPFLALVETPGALVGLGGEVVDDTDPVGQPLIAVTSDGIAWSRVPGDPALEDLRPVDLVVTGQDRAILLAEGSGSGFSLFEVDAHALGIGAQP